MLIRIKIPVLYVIMLSSLREIRILYHFLEQILEHNSRNILADFKQIEDARIVFFKI